MVYRRYRSSNCLEDFCQASEFPAGNLNPEPPEYETEVLPIRPKSSVKFYGILFLNLDQLFIRNKQQDVNVDVCALVAKRKVKIVRTPVKPCKSVC